MSSFTETSLPVTGAWLEGMPSAFRKFVDLGQFELESGFVLPNVRVAYETWGTFTGTNAVLIEHAFSGDSHAVGPTADGQVSPGWWGEVIGAGHWLDTNKWFVVCANVLGGCQGTTGPSSLAPDGKAWGSRWPRVTARDQVAVEIALADHLGIETFASAMGGSMGGMRVMEWLIMQPGRVRSAMLSATSAVASADQVATNTTQIRAITNDPNWHGGDYYDKTQGPITGLQLARQIAHINYRTEYELATRFGTDAQPQENPFGSQVTGRHHEAGRFAVQSYLDHHGVKLAKRFDAGTYVALTDCMNTHDIGRGRGSVVDVLGSIDVPVVISGIDSDRLFPLYQQEQLATLIPTASPLRVVHSPYGHDSFLIENEMIGALVQETLAHVVQ